LGVEKIANGTLTLGDLRSDPKRHRKESLIRSLFKAAATLSVVVSLLIVVALVGPAFEFITSVDPSALWTNGWFPRRGAFDVRTIFVGTMLVTGIAFVVGAPLGLGVAVYLSEFARPKARRILKPSLEVLAGIPSVVFGYFALTWISPHIVNRFFPGSSNFNLLAAGIAVGLLITPLIASVAEDALRSVPLHLREASYGLGAHKRTTTMKVVFPAAISGIMAAFIVGLSRAIGETMVVAIASGASGGSLLQLDPRQPGQTMTAAMASLAAGTDQVKGADLAFPSLFFVGFLLFVITFALNLGSARLVRKYRRSY